MILPSYVYDFSINSFSRKICISYSYFSMYPIYAASLQGPDKDEKTKTGYNRHMLPNQNYSWEASLLASCFACTCAILAAFWCCAMERACMALSLSLSLHVHVSSLQPFGVVPWKEHAWLSPSLPPSLSVASIGWCQCKSHITFQYSSSFQLC